MLFHVTAEIYPTINLDDDKRVREVFGPQLQKMLQSGKVREAGILSGTRAGFFLVDIDAPEEPFELMGPETYAGTPSPVGPLTSSASRWWALSPVGVGVVRPGWLRKPRCRAATRYRHVLRIIAVGDQRPYLISA